VKDSELERLIGYMDLYHRYRGQGDKELGVKESLLYYAMRVIEFSGCKSPSLDTIEKALEVSKARRL